MCLNVSHMIQMTFLHISGDQEASCLVPGHGWHGEQGIQRGVHREGQVRVGPFCGSSGAGFYRVYSWSMPCVCNLIEWNTLTH